MHHVCKGKPLLALECSAVESIQMFKASVAERAKVQWIRRWFLFRHVFFIKTLKFTSW